jgi:hypothetical protein
MANAAQLKHLVDVGSDYHYYSMLMALVCISLILQVSTGSQLLLPYEAVRPMKQFIVEHIIRSVFCELWTEAEDTVDHQYSTNRWQYPKRSD